MNIHIPKVSIVLPTYNGSRYIRQSITSCLNQRYNNIELIIVNDGSKDETHNIIASYKDNRLIYVRHKINKGLSESLNTGFDKATGEYLTWTSDDNYYAVDAIKKMLMVLIKEKYLFVYSDYYLLNEDFSSSKLSIVRLPKSLRLNDYNGVGPCFLYSRKIKNIVGNYDKDASLVEDYDYWIRVSKKFSMYHLNKPLYYYRIHSASLSDTKYYEVRIIDTLIRIKHNKISVEEGTTIILNLIIERSLDMPSKPLKTILFFPSVILRKKITLLRMREYITNALFSKKIYRELQYFKTNTHNLKYARASLIRMLHTSSAHHPSTSTKRWNDWPYRNTSFNN